MDSWKKIILKPDDTLEKAIHVLDSEALRIVMVADENGCLLGTITDGDVRRALIRRHGMGTHLVNVMNEKPVVAFAENDRKEILAMMKSQDLLQIPVVSRDRRIMGLEMLKNLLEGNRFDNQVFLMAGGFGKRLRPLTDTTPKPLLKVGNKPILETILNQFIAAGFHDFYMSIYYKAQMVRDHFGDGRKWGVSIRYVHEKEPLGTAGALGLLPKDMPDLPLIVMNGDLLTKVNFGHLLNYHTEQGGVATMCIREYDLQVPFGVIEAEGQRVISIREKPIQTFFVNAGIYVLNPSLLQHIDGRSYLDMPSLLDKQIKNNEQVNMFPVHEYWIDIGRMEEFERANREV